MKFDFSFFFQSILLGVGLAMDAFSVSLANGLNEPKMKKSRHCFIAGVFSFFQFIMPVIGYFCVHTVASFFSVFQTFIPWIALILLSFIGVKMLIEGIKSHEEEIKPSAVGLGALMLQGIATSIDALSVGFTISDYTTTGAILCCLIIALVTFIICTFGISIGKKFGTKLANKASILGGSILIIIGLEIFITGFFS